MKPVHSDSGENVKEWLLWFLGMASLMAILVVSVFAWIDSRKVPEITFAAPPSVVAVVDVRGAIATPGVVIIQPGDRLIDVIDQSGGLSTEADVNLVNLSSRVSDGQMIVIPTQISGGSSPGSGLININTASVTELDQLPGIGAVRAEQIIAHRQAHGPFQSVDDLVNVDGISPGLLETLRPLIRVSGDD